MSEPETELPKALPHGSFEEVLPDVFFVTGTTRPTFLGATWQFSRNMVVVRDGRALTLVNTVRLDDEGLSALARLGNVEHVVRLGAFHGIDDRFYLERFGAKLWGLPGMTHEGGRAHDRELAPGGAVPCASASTFVFTSSKQPEGLLLLERDGGALVSCDSLQNWVEPDRFFDDASIEKMKTMGFFASANLGPGWKMACTPEASDLARVLELRFRHLLPAHGTPLLDDAFACVERTIRAENAARPA